MDKYSTAMVTINDCIKFSIQYYYNTMQNLFNLIIDEIVTYY